MRLRLVAVAVTVGALMGGTATVPAAAAPAQKHCTVPAGGTTFARARPDQVALDPAAVQQAIDYASRHNRLSVKVFRNDCLVASGPWEPATESMRWNIFSATKSVISLLTGIAVGDGRIGVDDPIGRYLPTGPGWGDRAHRALTVRQLLTQTSGLKQSVASEGLTLISDPNVARQALALPLVRRPGTAFEYTQRAPDLLAYVLQRAVGEDLQAFAQRRLFSPVGIRRSDYSWLRDQAGNTYGYAHLFIPPAQFAKLGLLVGDRGRWRGKQVVPASWIRAVARPTATNGCYGFLFWTNAGTPCTGANFPSAETQDNRAIPSAPPDLFAMVGFLQQNNFVIPSLDMTVTWTGVLGDESSNLQARLSASGGGSDLYYDFFRLLMRAVRDRHVPDPGPYVAPPNPPSFDVNNFADPSVFLGGLFPGSGCSVIACPR